MRLAQMQQRGIHYPPRETVGGNSARDVRVPQLEPLRDLLVSAALVHHARDQVVEEVPFVHVVSEDAVHGDFGNRADSLVPFRRRSRWIDEDGVEIENGGRVQQIVRPVTSIFLQPEGGTLPVEPVGTLRIGDIGISALAGRLVPHPQEISLPDDAERHQHGGLPIPSGLDKGICDIGRLHPQAQFAHWRILGHAQFVRARARVTGPYTVPVQEGPWCGDFIGHSVMPFRSCLRPCYLSMLPSVPEMGTRPGVTSRESHGRYRETRSHPRSRTAGRPACRLRSRRLRRVGPAGRATRRPPSI